jgi:hypothetical protein
MAFAADQAQVSAQSSSRSGPIVRFIWHHQASTDDDGTIQMMVSGSRQVSATWTVSNTGRITAVVPESRRPWTTASYLDDGALTVECANSSGNPDWGISAQSHEACARLAAYANQAYGIPLQRANAGNGWTGHMGHNEAPDTYATFCPGHLDIDYIINRAGQLLGGGLSSDPLGEDMPTADEIASAVWNFGIHHGGFDAPALVFLADIRGITGDTLVAARDDPWMHAFPGASDGAYKGAPAYIFLADTRRILDTVLDLLKAGNTVDQATLDKISALQTGTANVDPKAVAEALAQTLIGQLGNLSPETIAKIADASAKATLDQESKRLQA